MISIIPSFEFFFDSNYKKFYYTTNNYRDFITFYVKTKTSYLFIKRNALNSTHSLLLANRTVLNIIELNITSD